MRMITLVAAISLAAIALSSGVFAQVNFAPGVVALPPNTYIQYYVDYNFGATAHTERVEIGLTASQIGWQVELVDNTAAAMATTTAAWGAALPAWGNATAAAGGPYNLVLSATTDSYITPSLSGIHRFTFEVTNLNTTLTNNLTLTVDNGPTATATIWLSGPFTPTQVPAAGLQAPVAGTSGQAFIQHNAGQCYGITTLGAQTDELRFDFSVLLPSTATVVDVSIWGITDVGTPTVYFDVFCLPDDGGSTPSATLTLVAQAGSTTQGVAHFVTSALTGTTRFRVVHRAGASLPAAQLSNFRITWSHGSEPLPVGGAAAIPNQPPVSITPTSTTFTTSPMPLNGAGGTGAPGTFTWSIQGTTPTGVSLSTTTGASTQLIFGATTPTGSTVTIRAANGTTGEFDEETYTLNFGGGGGGPTLTITTTTLPNGQVTVSYSGNATATAGGGATGPYTWTVTSGALPGGLTLGGSTGLTETLSGTPTAAGTFNFDLTISNGSLSDSQSYTVDITAVGVLTITTTSLPAGTNGTLYSGGTINSVGGTGSHTWSLTAGTLPAGLTLGTGPGTSTAVTGTPTATGSFPITVQVVDSSGTPQTDTQAFTIVIAAPGGPGPGPGGVSGGGGGGGGCAADSNAPWMLAIGLLALFGFALRMRSRRV